MKKILFLLFCCVVLLNYHFTQLPEQENKIIPYLDLSHKNLDHIPDLSKLRVKKLNLSHNQITEFKIDSLPQNLESLDLSHNKLLWGVSIKKGKRLEHLKELNLAHNEVLGIDIKIPLKRLIVANNPIYEIDALNLDCLKYFDRLNTPGLDGARFFNKNNPKESLLIPFSKIDTIVSNGEPLIDVWYIE
ncbi:hypothetical protein [Ornithobacterium rhinotracheale]|uniref:Leucine-rich repeat domain-containing protein n=1 Tax=Ornithobacterium rhinotracheale (strain ATCC 51463 / DSM 15997 / CCUG 23171 / CIP 104009 / LMG 9086) TaxID=867902 RepID=I3ZXG5_ORNRL|nr:hypothetical protein [Ornithobacterium rhinotracheale]AFL96399.1 hypothetical protein Ornrh_0176 [Ornithobacterium rhinotracheale DSM 15997]AIP98623.1 hypothetical protein Q785_00985 [Ornithobacterium rhinotracheale ORT-UMN 88]KGB67795.1 hypothetical protein Q787_00950 [Ornithobacterium rhinotracheale H06-030791]MCK0194728.1 hypothetical protein [Ornithobacterium rhinotracheale]MCK0201095.1 hypothetical protein [Ornithobacterium rhinotracheale]